MESIGSNESSTNNGLNGGLTSQQAKENGSAKNVDLERPSKSPPTTIAVVKRNGMLVPFRRDRIFSAIEAAFRATNSIAITSPLPQEIYSTVQEVTALVADELSKQAMQGAALTVEGIQDLVEVKLMQSGHYEVARNYIIYRDEHKQLRDDSPRNLKVLRRDGKTFVRFNPMKIASAIERAFRASLKVDGPSPQEIINAVNLLTNKVVSKAVERAKSGATIEIELIQDEVERQMMAEGFYQVAKDFIIYRAQRSALRTQPAAEEVRPAPQITGEKEQEEKVEVRYSVTRRDGSAATISEGDLRTRISFACKEFEQQGLVSSEEVLQESLRNFYDGIKAEEIDQANIMAARSKIEKEPAYSYVASGLLLDVIYREAFGIDAHNPKLEEEHRKYFKSYLSKAISLERLDPKLLEFDLDFLSQALDLKRDLNFAYLGLQTLYDRYLIHSNDIRLETPQIFWMRVAMGLSVLEGEQKNQRAVEFYNVLSQFRFVSSTPTLFNAGTMHPQLSSCYLSTVMDDLQHIFKVISDDAQLSKWAGGLGNDWTNVRATGARIKGTNGRSQGVIPFLKVANDTAVAVNQGGKRKGAMCAYIETWHLDIEDFLELRKNTGDERRRTHDMNTANWIPDLFMKRVASNGQWTLFSPSDVPDLHDLYGTAFEKRYEEYEKMVDQGEIKLFKRVEAMGIWRKMLSMLYETGHPWMTFKDPSNIRSPQDHVGVVHSSNLCTEILLNTSKEETAVCNLGSINLPAHIKDGKLDAKLLAATVRTAVRMLDNVIDINFYPTPEARNANLRHRPIGLGVMGFQDALYEQRLSYASPEAVNFADQSMELISYHAILASSDLAKEKGTYSTYKGSKWDRGLLPIDTIALLEEQRGGDVDVDRSSTLDWETLRKAVRQNGMRNSNTMAIAPTATISNITGITQSIEPAYKHLYAKSNLSGEFIVYNVYLVNDLKALGLWDHEMVDDLKYFDGSIMEIERIPDDLKRIYLTAFEIEPEWLIECASRRQKWIDMGQSLNLYIAEPSGKKLHDMYLHAWRKGLKTTYYLRSLGATQIEKSTTDINRRGLQPRWMKSKSASSNIKVDRQSEGEEPRSGDAPAGGESAGAENRAIAVPKAVCNLDGDCESCQ
ncbi:MAG: ribonucleoside-diphosphate reductase subunit alpha [Deltaproteobacteria bacterium]|nr:ribonucleoside-diphosphate reductase subunit alpha [Deltaproteobacteria bacterium]